MTNRSHLTDRRTVLASAVALTVPAGAAKAAGSREGLDHRLDAVLDRVFAAEQPVGLAGMIWREGEMGWGGARGLRAAGQVQGVTLSDKWHLGSNTKAMTAALWARLVEQGRAVWDMPVADAVEAAGWDVELHSGWSDRTVDDFLCHQAGLYDEAYLTPLWLMASRMSTASLPEQRLGLAVSMLKAAPTGARGTFQYGNANYILVGALMEGITGVSWEALMQSQLFEPLGITSGGFGAPQGQQPWGHDARGTALSPELPASDNPKALGPAGTVHMSLQDYGLFLRAMQRPGWLSAASLERLSIPREGQNYALGWIIVPGQEGWARGKVLSHDGSNTAWYVTAAMDLGSGLTVVSASNDGTRGAKACPQMLSFMIGAMQGS